jgi:Tol biopolymer transport system component/tRNA A-37 threonylcarbamoyl transferase component Bud32
MKGRTLAHYEILDKLGEGGMGAVWKARDTRLNRIVAIKTLPADKVADAQRKRRFVQEAQSASALNHPNIVTIHDIASDNGVDFIVMELVRGKTLSELISRRGPRLNDLLSYAIQTADALSKAHAAGIVHRDLKPGNIMVTGEGCVKVLDFGLAKLTEPAPPADDEETRTLKPQTEDGAIVGTLSYMSPEQAEGKPVDARSDIFSFGAVLYEMATGSRAFQGSSKLSTLSAILRENPKPPSEVAAGVPRDLDKIIARCLRKDPARRFQNMTDLKLALEDLKEDSESGSSGEPIVAAKHKSKLPLVAAATAVVIAGAAGWYFLRSASKPLPPRSIPLTAYAGSESHPSFSPDGNQVAFDWNGEKQENFDIYVKLVSGGAPLRLTTNPAEDTFPAWSPDGSQIAFVRAGAGIYLISPLGGQERRLTGANTRSLTWMPDGKSLLASIQEKDAAPYTIFQVSMDGEMRKVTSPLATGQVALAGDRFPAVSPDGQTVAFERYVNAAADLYVSPVTGGEPRRLTHDLRQMGGLVWINNREILFSSNRAGGQTLWRIATDGRSEPLPVRGVEGDASYPAIAYPAKSPARVAYQRSTLDYNIWRMEVSVPEHGPARTITAPAPVIASTRTDSSPRFSPDGKRMVFASDRNGYLEIWAANSDGSNVTQLTALASVRSGSPRWSPDGQKIVFDSLASGNNDIWMVNAEGGSPKRLTMEPSNDARPSWSRDGRWIYFRSDRSGAIQIWKIPSAEPYKPAVQVTQNGGHDEIESADGKILYFTKPAKGLWSLQLAGSQETLVQESIQPGLWDVTDKGVYFLNGQIIQFLSFANHKVIRIGQIGKPGNTARPTFTVTRDGRWIAWAQLDHEDSDLMLLENFR